MVITRMAQCGKQLDFNSRPLWPTSLPMLIWNNIQLTHFNSNGFNSNGKDVKPASTSQIFESRKNADEAFVISGEIKIENLIKDLYPKLTLVELARLRAKAIAIDLNLNWSDLSLHYGLRANEDGFRTLELAAFLPPSVQQWCIEKDVSVRDLAPLRGLTDIRKIEDTLIRLFALNPSRSDGVRALEWIVDLILMGADFKSSLSSAKTFDELNRDLHTLRFPLATRQAQAAEALVKTLPWPKRARARVARVGDQSGFEIKLFIHSRLDLKKQVDGLSAVLQKLEAQNIERL